MTHRFKATFTEVALYKTWFFRLASVAFIALGVPLLATATRGTLGFLVLIYLAVLAGLAERSFGRVLRAMGDGMSLNKWLVLFALWYSIGVWLNILMRGNGLADWRLMLGPVTLLITLCYAFGFARDKEAFRVFQIGLAIALGVQSLFTIRELSGSAGLAREMWIELQGAWELGNQSAYAAWIILLPVLIWRALVERGALRWLLLGSALLTGVAASMGSFATPLVLLAIGGGVVIGLTLLFPIQGQRRPKGIALAAVILIAGILSYHYTRDNPLFAAGYYRIESFLVDPQGGGYSGEDRSLSRVFLAEISINSFLAKPWFGMGGGSIRYSPYVGGHSSLFDSLGAYGLLGGGGALAGLTLTLLIAAARRFFTHRSWETLLALTSVILLLVAGVTNPYGDGLALFLVLIMARPFSLATGQEKFSHLETPTSLSKRHQHRSILGIGLLTIRFT